MWRAFVYSHEVPEDRAKQAYSEFVGLDGAFRPNVIVQVKNGPIDFQPREPFHPLFGAMPRTPLMMELQITKEYLGFATHLVYLGTLYEEVLQADTHARGEGSTVARVVDGSLEGHALTGIAGVANIGVDRTWSGSHFDQANWYAFGRLAWNPQESARAIAEDWAALTFSPDPQVTGPIVRMMMDSREAAVDYMTPLGLHHLMARGHHYGPGPGWTEARVRTGRRCTTTAQTARASVLTAAPAEATPWASTRRRSPRSMATPSGCPSRCCCGSIMCRGITACARAGGSGMSWSGAIRGCAPGAVDAGHLGRPERPDRSAAASARCCVPADPARRSAMVA